MKVTFKLLSGSSFNIEFPDDTTIAQVKERVATEKGYDAKTTKLIYSGKILQDADTVKASGVQESGFVVVALTKTKPKETPAPAPVATPVKTETAPQPTPVVQTPQQPTVPQQQPAPVVQTPAPQTQQPAATTTPPPTTTSEDNRLVMGAQYQAILTQFQEMGFGKDEIEKCMRAAFNNPERALDYLTGGIPPHLEAIANAPRPQPAAQQPAAQQQQPAATTPPPASQPSTQSLQNILQQAQQQAQAQQQFGDLASIMPQFNQLRAAIQQNPELLQPLMQRIAQQNPQLFQIISQNPQEFIRMLNEPVPQSPLGQGQGQGAFGGQRPPAPQGTIYITQQEKEAIDRLVDMGFDRLTATQAYFACDKNFELAANFLLESGTFGMDEGDYGDGGDAGDDEDIYGGDQQQ